MDATQIGEHMKVVSSDGQHVGIVDGIEGDRIKLTKSDPASGGQHRFVGLSDVEQVRDGKVCLNSQAKAQAM